MLVYATHTGTRDITERMEDMLTRHGFRVAVMKADAVAPDRREAWVAEQVEKGLDVLVCHPRLVQTGLDLIDFRRSAGLKPTTASTSCGRHRAARGASARAGRCGVVFMAHRNSLQADALKLVAKKLQSSLAVEGELPEDGLAAYGDDGDDLMLALARKIVNGDEDEAETVEAVFAAARDAESTAEEYLVDDGWNAVEPETVPVSGDGHHTDGIGPAVDTVQANGLDGAGEAAALALLLGGVPRSGAGRQAQPEAQARIHVPLRVGARHGAGDPEGGLNGRRERQTPIRRR